MKRLWIDTDLALGAASGDVDDGFALAVVLAAPEVEILGISTVTGNTDHESARRSVADLLAAFGADARGIPVVGPKEAAPRIAGLPAGASLLALGPLSNVMRAVELEPALPAAIEVRAVGTVLRPWRHPLLHAYCLNTQCDRRAACAFLALPWVRRRVFPLDVVKALRIGWRDLDRLTQLGEAGAYLARYSRRWLRQAPLRYFDLAFPAWDLVAALDAVGELPGARHSGDGQRLVAFDHRAAKERFLELLSGA